jgi:hypothetical protein
MLEKKEVHSALKDLASNKAPGVDGITAKVLKDCWAFIDDNFYELVKHYWNTGELYSEFIEGIIRLIPKEIDIRRIKDWRPITLLQVAYKTIAKLLAIRLSTVLPQLINEKKPVLFLKGRFWITYPLPT